tara:strand:+ start:5912 stop:6550 length:639 start_codon:yes stop_codon:yes gene_type:complete
MQQPSYYAIIPAEVRYSELKPSAKLLYGEITALANKKGYCFSTNNYFAELYNVTKNTISLWIKDLLKHGFISVEIKYRNKQIIERRLYITINNDSIIKNDGRGIIKNGEDNNTRVNNTSNINNRKIFFQESIFLVLGISNQIKDEFFNYWSEENHSKTKMKYEIEKTWNLEKRLKRWVNNSNKWGNKKESKVETIMSAHQNVKEMIKKANQL